MSSPPAAHSPSFVFATCQVGAEPALKAEVARHWPDLTFAYSRPGFLTFKLPVGASVTEDFDLRGVFVRTSGSSLGKAAGGSPAELAQAVWRAVGDERFDRMHVWQRDTFSTGHRGFEPHLTEQAQAAESALRGEPAGARIEKLPTEIDQRVLDCIVVDPALWWIGAHRAARIEQTWPGSIPPLVAPADMVSRAWLKMEEALAWSQLPIKPGDTLAEIGCSPGGASQSLLSRGLKVIGIDPADVDPSVLSHPRFTHFKKRGADVRRREFRHVRWLTADVNVAPAYTLDTVEAIVTHEMVDVQGMLLTLKLLDWKLADELPAYLDRIGNWGFRHVVARQLAHNRQEICVAATKNKRPAR